MAQLFANNASSTLAYGINGTDNTLVLASGGGVKFPSPSGGDYFLATLTQGVGLETSWEIVKCTARTTDTLTVTRAQEGTAAAAWAAGTKVEMRITKGAMDGMATLGANTFTGQQTFAELRETVYSLAGTSIDPANGSIQYKTLSGNTTLTEALDEGQSVTLMIDDGTAYTITWPTMTWVGGTAPTLPTSGYGVIVLWKISTTLYGKYIGAA